MTDIIFLDSARKGGTGKSKTAMNGSVILAKDYGNTLLIEEDYFNPNYTSTYSDFFENNGKNSYSYLKDALLYRIEKIKVNAKYKSEAEKEAIKNKIKIENPNLNDSELEKSVKSYINKQIKEEILKSGKGSPKLEDYIQQTKMEGLDILIGVKNQSDLISDLIRENLGLLNTSMDNAEYRLKNEFIEGLQKLSSKYENIVIDGYASYDSLTKKTFEMANKHILVAENTKASIKSVYNNMHETINSIFELMVGKSPAPLAITAFYDINTANKTGIAVYDEIIGKSQEILKTFDEYDLKKARNESISEDTMQVVDTFKDYRNEISALVKESANKRKNMTTLCVSINKIIPTFFGGQRGKAKKRYCNIKNELSKYGINVITPGLRKNGGGLIYFYDELGDVEDTEGVPMTFHNPNHKFSKQIKSLVDFIKSKNSWIESKE